ncbi:fimbrial protein [Enterobacter sp. 118C5]|uniref:fimbrial protein n=1 Tax=Enterobacter TaxID=547 RepID=UPI002A81DCFE|nr:fimbrial protein [Enterobacter sp. 118C5]
MKIRTYILPPAVGLLTMAAGQLPAGATDSVLKVTGKVVASGCEVEFNKKVTIGTFSGKDFPVVGSTSAFKAMNIDLTDCYSKLASVSVSFSGVPDKDNPTLLGLTDSGTGGTVASGVGVELLDNGGKTIPFDKPKPQVFALDEGSNTLSFLLRYKSTKVPVTPGDAAAVLYFDLTYQ